MSSLYYDLAQELVTAIEAHPFFSGLTDEKMEAVFEEDASFLKHIEGKVNKAGGSTVSISFEGARNLAGKSTKSKQRAVRFIVTLWTRKVLRLKLGDRPAYELVEALEELLDGMTSTAATLHPSCEHSWEWENSGVVPDPRFDRWELALTINTRTPNRVLA